jgi:hypothetical protein
LGYARGETEGGDRQLLAFRWEAVERQKHIPRGLAEKLISEKLIAVAA